MFYTVRTASRACFRVYTDAAVSKGELGSENQGHRVLLKRQFTDFLYRKKKEANFLFRHFCTIYSHGRKCAQMNEAEFEKRQGL